jgi:hypothetical protein
MPPVPVCDSLYEAKYLVSVLESALLYQLDAIPIEVVVGLQLSGARAMSWSTRGELQKGGTEQMTYARNDTYEDFVNRVWREHPARE